MYSFISDGMLLVIIEILELKGQQIILIITIININC